MQNVGHKLAWTGLTIIVAISPFVLQRVMVIVGAIIMSIGLVLMWLDK